MPQGPTLGLTGLTVRPTVTDGTNTVKEVREIEFPGGTVAAGAGVGEVQVTFPAGAALTLTDGTHTVDNVGTIDFTSGATVSAGATGVADVAIASSGGTVTDITAANGLSGGSITSTGTIGVAGVTQPTVAGLPFTVWQNQGGATIADNAVGVSMFCPSSGGSNALRFLGEPAPSTPYSFTAHVAMTQLDSGHNGAAGIGWSDGTQYQFIGIVGANASGAFANVQYWTTNSAFSANEFSGEQTRTDCWFQITDDGTNVTFALSNDGINFVTAYTVAKASGALGASGYSHVGLIGNGPGSDVYATFTSLAQAA